LFTTLSGNKKEFKRLFRFDVEICLEKKDYLHQRAIKKNIASVEITTLIIIKFEDNLQIVIIFEV